MGISYVAVVLLRFMKGKCLKDNLGVTLKMALGDLLRDPLGGKKGRRGAKTGSMSKVKSSLVLEEGRFKHTGHYQAPRGMNILTGGMRNLNACIGWYEIWSWKQEVGVGEETVRNA